MAPCAPIDRNDKANSMPFTRDIVTAKPGERPISARETCSAEICFRMSLYEICEPVDGRIIADESD